MDVRPEVILEAELSLKRKALEKADLQATVETVISGALASFVVVSGSKLWEKNEPEPTLAKNLYDYLGFTVLFILLAFVNYLYRKVRRNETIIDKNNCGDRNNARR